MSTARNQPRKTVRWALILLATVPPFALGAVHAPAYLPLLLTSGLVGLVSWAGARRDRAAGQATAPVPGARLLLLAVGLVAFQLVPLPPRLLSWASPGTAAFLDHYSLLPATGWAPLSVSPADTFRGLLFLCGWCVLHAAAARELGGTRARLQLARASAGAVVALSVLALAQARGSEPTTIYGWFKPQWDWAVFGPYVNHNHFAGYLTPALVLSLGLVARAAGQVREAAGRRRRSPLLVLGEHSSARLLGWATLATLGVVALFKSESRAGLLGLGGALVAAPLLRRGRLRLAASLLLLALAALFWVDPQGLIGAFEARGGLERSRFPIWADALNLWLGFPVFGAGLNAFSKAFPLYQTSLRDSFVGEAHDEYLQALTDTGVLGFALLLAWLWQLLPAAVRVARRGGALEGSLLAALLSTLATNLVDFNWQIPANATAFAILSGAVVGADQRAGSQEAQG